MPAVFVSCKPQMIRIKTDQTKNQTWHARLCYTATKLPALLFQHFDLNLAEFNGVAFALQRDAAFLDE